MLIVNRVLFNFAIFNGIVQLHEKRADDKSPASAKKAWYSIRIHAKALEKSGINVKS